MKRYGLIGTCYNTGISHIASGFAEHLEMKALLADYKPFAKFPDRFKNHRLTKTMDAADLEWLLTEIDVLMIIETPYEWRVLQMAHQRGIKVVFMPMIEWLDRSRPELKYVDCFVCPSSYTLQKIREAGLEQTAVVVPSEVPVDLEKFPRTRSVKQVRTFLHNAGHGGIGGRNSTKELMEAIPLAKSDAKFIIRSQFPLKDKSDDVRITYIEGNVENYWDLYEEGDVWIMPWKYGVAALGLQESMGAGMLPVITDMEPFNQFMPKELLIEPATLTQRPIYAGQSEVYATQAPHLIACKIDELYNMDMEPLAKWAKETARAWSWEVWGPKYTMLFDNL